MSFFSFVQITLIILIILALIRVIKGPTLWDRLLGFNMISSKIVMLIVILGFVFDSSFYLDVALAYAILGFIGTILIAKFIETRGD